MRLSIYPLGLGNEWAFNILIDRMAGVTKEIREGVWEVMFILRCALF